MRGHDPCRTCVLEGIKEVHVFQSGGLQDATDHPFFHRSSADYSNLLRAAKRHTVAEKVHVNPQQKCMKSHTPECAKIEEFAATLVPMKTYHLCMQDFATKDYTLELQGTSITITQQQFDDGTWQDIIRRAFQ